MHTITAKHDHTLLHRLAGQLGRPGSPRPAPPWATGWQPRSALLLPLVLLMKARFLLSRVIHGDDTSVKLRVPGQKRPARHTSGCTSGMRTIRMWCSFSGGLHGNGASRISQRIQGVSPGRRLGAVRVPLWPRSGGARLLGVSTPAANSWRPPRGARTAPTKPLELIGQLYTIEHELPPLLPPSDNEQGRAAASSSREEQPADWPRQRHSQPRAGRALAMAGRAQGQGVAEIEVGPKPSPMR